MTISRIIKSAGHLKRLKLVVFSDEKKFSLDGPDGYNYYYHDLRKEKIFLDRHHSREGGVTVWGAISYYGTIDLVFVNCRMTAAYYKTVLEMAVPQFQDIFGPLTDHFQTR